jgi:hypothetical protein
MTARRGFPWGRLWLTVATAGALVLAVWFVVKNFF